VGGGKIVELRIGLVIQRESTRHRNTEIYWRRLEASSEAYCQDLVEAFIIVVVKDDLDWCSGCCA
jgi:hypothetical protein